MSDKIKVVIIDDELLARKRVRGLLEKVPTVDIIGECSNGKEAVDFLSANDAQLIFLDIQMPEMNGFEVVRMLEEDKLPEIIFVTAYDAYAVKAFDVQALDYLLKPFDDERFFQALERAQDRISGSESDDYQLRLKSLLQQEAEREPRLKRFMIKKAGKILLLPTHQVEWIEASGCYAALHSGTDSHLIRETMNNLEAKLDPDLFIRIHRSTIVKIDQIKEFQSYFKGDYMVILQNGEKLGACPRIDTSKVLIRAVLLNLNDFSLFSKVARN
ncbi:MAG: response regulator transcription factor, partial [bacterium]|nr:response regulator transcription factor [bacterium]